MSEYIVELNDVQLHSQRTAILRNVNVSFPFGKCTLILGPSGSGKSVILKVAAGIIPPDGGDVFIRGKNLTEISEKELREFRRKSGFVFQDAALWENMSVFENLALPLQFHMRDLTEGEISSKIEAALENVNLSDVIDRRPSELSTGEQKVISFIRALMLEPEIVFLDEPTVSVDSVTIEKMLKITKNLKERGCTIIIVTHDPFLTSMIADYLVVIDDGSILETGPFDEVKNSQLKKVQLILSQVLDQATTYDADLLEILDNEIT